MCWTATATAFFRYLKARLRVTECDRLAQKADRALVHRLSEFGRRVSQTAPRYLHINNPRSTDNVYQEFIHIHMVEQWPLRGSEPDGREEYKSLNERNRMYYKYVFVCTACRRTG